jgi:LL-H family phage holin
MSDNTMQIIVRIIAVAICLLISGIVLPYIERLKDLKEMDLITKTINMAVKAAEQTIKGSGKGQLKKAEVKDIVNAWLSKVGIKVSDELIDVIIEDAVYVMNSNK